MPVSGAFCNDNIMLQVKPGDHGSTFGGNPLGMAVAKRAVEVIIEDKMVENAKKLGEILADKLTAIKSPLVKDVRGQGLFWAIEINDQKTEVNGNDYAYCLLNRGLLTKATHENSVRIAPALVITERELTMGINKLKQGLRDLKSISAQRRKEAKSQRRVAREARQAGDNTNEKKSEGTTQKRSKSAGDK